MKTVSAFEAQTHFGRILDQVAGGEEIVITRHGRAVARIVPEGGASRESVRDAVASLRALRARIASRKGFRPLSDAAIRSAINQER